MELEMQEFLNDLEQCLAIIKSVYTLYILDDEHPIIDMFAESKERHHVIAEQEQPNKPDEVLLTITVQEHKWMTVLTPYAKIRYGDISENISTHPEIEICLWGKYLINGLFRIKLSSNSEIDERPFKIRLMLSPEHISLSFLPENIKYLDSELIRILNTPSFTPHKMIQFQK
jgi:hypothetical protein